MLKQIAKSVLLGLLIGAAFFIMPFFMVKFFIFFILIGAILRLAFRGRHRRGWGPGYQFAFADKIRNMSDEEYQSFTTKMKDRYHHHHGRCGYYYDKNASEKTENTSSSTNPNND